MRETDRGATFLLAACLLPFVAAAVVWAFGPESSDSAAPPGAALGVIGRTLVVAGGGALLATLFGGALGVLVRAYRVPGGDAWLALWLAPFLLPSVVVTTGLQSWLADGPLVGLVRGPLGAVLISGVQMAPLVLWGVGRSLAAMPRAERLAVRATLAPAAAARLLAGRAAPVAFRLGTLSFLLLLPRLEIPAYTGVETIGTRALAAFTAAGSDLEGWLWCGCCLAIGLPVLRFASAPLRLDAAPATLGAPNDAAPRSAVVTSIALGAAFFPLLLGAGLVHDALGSGLDPATAEASRWIGALARDLVRVVPLALGLALVGWRIAVGGSRRALGVAALPLLLPGTLPALVLVEGALPFLPRWVADGTLPLSAAQGLRFLGVAVLLGAIADRSIPAAERDAARALPPEVRRWRVLLPRAAGGIAASAALLAALILGEVESASLVVPPGRLLPAVELHQLLHFRYDVQAARLSLALAVVTGILVAGLGRIGRARGEEGPS